MKNIFSKVHPGWGGFLVFLVILLIFSSFFFVRGFLQFHQGGEIHPRNPFTIFSSGAKQPIGIPNEQDVESIEGWMTFSYINLRFHLPDIFLEEKLSIDTTKYPKISLDSYARTHKLDKTTFLKQVKDVIKTTIVPPPNP